MAVKIPGCVTKVLAVAFTSVVAPVLVDLAVRDIHGETAKPADNSAPSMITVAPPANAPAVIPPAEVACVISQGEGRTQDEALRDALRAALLQALAARVDPATWARRGQALLDAMWRDSNGLILGWRELASRKEWRLTGSRHHEQVAVNLDCRALDARLRAIRNLDWSRPTH